ncbi:MAG: class B sortase [Clostridiales bacterium]|nr:class B sortase [Clostridiales bacterium]
MSTKKSKSNSNIKKSTTNMNKKSVTTKNDAAKNDTPNAEYIKITNASLAMEIDSDFIKSILDEEADKKLCLDSTTDDKTQMDQFDEIEMEIIEVEKPQKKKRKIVPFDFVRWAVMFGALCLFAYSSYELTLIYVTGQETNDAHGEIANMFTVSIDDVDTEYYNVNGEKIVLNNTGDGTAFVWNFEKIKEYNPNAKGYIRQGNGTYIDNPIVQHPSDNDYYLNHLSNNYPSGVGSIFIDTRITEGLNAKNCILYGHNVQAWANHIMFGSLNFYYDDPSHCKENPTMDIYIGDHHYVYYVYAAFKVPATGSPVYTWEIETDEEFLEYVNTFKEQSIYDFKEAPQITADSHILTLSTCTTDHEQRMIIQLVRSREVFDVPVDQ